MNMFSGQGMLIRVYMYFMNATICELLLRHYERLGTRRLRHCFYTGARRQRTRSPWRTGVDLASSDGTGIHI